MRVSELQPRLGRPSEKDSITKINQILAAACDLFVEFGYRAVTMRMVAEKAQVSTRTLYNRYADKLTLFTACIDTGAAAFPRLEVAPGAEAEDVLLVYAKELVKMLSTRMSISLGMLVYREGDEFPELLRASEANQDRYLIQPLAAYLRRVGLKSRGWDEQAKLFVAMALSEWQRRIAVRRPPPSKKQADRHAALSVRIFLSGTGPHGAG